MPFRGTVGQLLVDEALPEKLRGRARVLDKKGLASLLHEVATQHTDAYPAVSKRLADIGREVATEFGGNSFGALHMGKAQAAIKYKKLIQAQVKRILDNDNLTEQQRHDQIVRAVGAVQEKQMDEILQESLQEGNPLALQVLSGSRGNKMNLASLRGADLLYTDHRDNIIPLPVLSSYSEGLKPSEYWAGAYGARRGVIATKMAVRDAGFFSKVLNQLAHRLVVVDEDDPRDMTMRGLPVETSDMDSEGSLLAHDVGGYQRNTVLTPKILKDLQRKGHEHILVRSPLIGGSPDGGVYARDVGVRERGRLPGRGEQVGLTSAQATSEPISQGQLSAKHSGGVAGQEKAVGGFEGISQQVQIPAAFKGANHATVDGTVERIEPAAAGGFHLYIGNEEHYVPAGAKLRVKHGERVEAGDPLTEGALNPRMIVEHKGIGEGRRRFVQSLREALKNADIKSSRRNLEVLARGLINHVRLTDEFAGHLPDDVLPYSTVEHLYEPREGHQIVDPRRALNQYLERPVLHYSIGTKVRPSVLQELKRFGIKEIVAHRDPPPFVPQMVRGMDTLQYDPDWMTRMYGSGLKGSLLDAVHTGVKSDEFGTSFVPGLARAIDFGRGTVHSPEPGATLPPEGLPLPDGGNVKHKKPVLDVQAIHKPQRKGFLSSAGSLFKSSLDQLSELRAMEQILLRARAQLEKEGVQLEEPKLPKPQGAGSAPSAPHTAPTATNPAAPAGLPKPPAPAAPSAAVSTPTSTPVPAPRWQPPTQAQPQHQQTNMGVHPTRQQGLFYGAQPEQMAQFVQNAQHFGAQLGGEPGSQLAGAVAFGSGLDANAVGTLTRGRSGASNGPLRNYSSAPYFDYLNPSNYPAPTPDSTEGAGPVYSGPGAIESAIINTAPRLYAGAAVSELGLHGAALGAKGLSYAPVVGGAAGRAAPALGTAAKAIGRKAGPLMLLMEGANLYDLGQTHVRGGWEAGGERAADHTQWFADLLRQQATDAQNEALAGTGRSFQFKNTAKLLGTMAAKAFTTSPTENLNALLHVKDIANIHSQRDTARQRAMFRPEFVDEVAEADQDAQYGNELRKNMIRVAPLDDKQRSDLRYQAYRLLGDSKKRELTAAERAKILSLREHYGQVPELAALENKTPVAIAQDIARLQREINERSRLAWGRDWNGRSTATAEGVGHHMANAIRQLEKQIQQRKEEMAGLPPAS